MAADESGQLSGSQPATDSGLSGSISPDGDSRQQTDIDDRPVGACYNELQAVKAAVDAARAADARVKDALAAFWACRDAAAAVAGIQSPSAKATSFLATTFEGREDDLRQIEKLIE
jgi:hypothetical protein